MAQTVLLKRSSVAGNVPDSSDLSLGEIAVNTADGAVYIKKGNNDIVAVADNDILHIDTSNSRVGIGTTSPSNRLHVNSGTDDWPIRAQSTDAKTGIIIQDTNTTNYLISESYTLSIGNQASLHASNLNIKSTGKVGLGTTAPSKRLHVVDSTAHQLQLQGSNSYWNIGTGWSGYYQDWLLFATSSGEKMVIDPNGKVGIGTNSPANLLSVESTGQFAGINIKSASSNGISYIDFGDADDNNIGGINYDNSTNTLQLRNNNTHYVFLKSSGNLGIGTGSPTRKLHVSGSGATVGIKVEATDGNQASLDLTNTEGAVRLINDGGSFFIYDDTDSAERLRIDTSGNVGIGATAPLATLHVGSAAGSLNSSAELFIPSGDALMRTLKIGHGASTASITTDDSTKPIAFTVGGGEKVRIATDGDVGIGVTSPAAKLHIVNNSTSTDALLLESTEDSSSAAPILAFKRNSASVADADYLGQLKFKGENDADQEVVYAKITSKIQDASDGSEDGLIEFANRKAGSNVITARLRSDSLQLLNGTALTVGGDITLNSFGDEILFGSSSNKLGYATWLMSASAGGLIKNVAGPLTLNPDNYTAFQINDVEKARIDSSGNVGINTSNPNYKLHVKETGTNAGALFIEDGTSGLRFVPSLGGGGFNPIVSTGDMGIIFSVDDDSSTDTSGALVLAPHSNNIGGIKIREDGRVGISTDSPDTTLDVTSSGVHGIIMNEDTGNSSASGRIFFKSTQRTNTILNVSGNLEFRTGASIGSSSGTVRLTIRGGDGKLQIGTGGTKYTFPTADGNANQVLQTDGSGNLSFATVSGGGSSNSITDADGDTKIQVEESADEDIIRFDTAGTQRMVITDAGRIGVNTQSPVAMLHVNGGIVAVGDGTNTTYYEEDKIHSYATSGFTIDGREGITLETTSDDKDITFKINDSVNGLQTYMTVDGGEERVVFNKWTRHVDDARILVGTGGDLQLYHNGITSNSNIENHTGGLYITNYADDQDIIFRSDDGSGGVQEYFRVDGGADRTIFTRSSRHQDGVIGSFGTDEDLQIYHDGSNSYINEGGTGDLLIRTNGTGVRLQKNTGEHMIKALTDGAVTLYYDNQDKLATKSDGVDITGELQADSLDIDGAGDISGNLTIGGNLIVNGTSTTLNTATLDVEDKNITLNKGSGDTSGSADGAGITIQDAVDASNDATILWDASNNEFDFSHDVNVAGQVSIDDYVVHNGDSNSFLGFNAADTFELVTGGTQKITADANAAYLRYQGSAKAYTQSWGLLVNGTLNADKLHMGAGATDLISVHHDGTFTSTYRNNTGGVLDRRYADNGNDGTTVEYQARVGMDGNYSSIGNFSSHNFYLRTNNTNRMTINSAGRVGVGTTNPDQLFHVEFANNDTSFSGGSGGAWGSQGIRIENTSSTVGSMAMLHLRSNDSDIHIAGIRKAANDSDLGFFFEGSEKVRFTNDGKVGIGTASPNSPLSVVAASNANAIRMYGRSADNYSELYASSNDGATNYAFLQGHSAQTKLYTLVNTPLLFGTNSTERMRIDNSGRLLVNATSTVFNDKLYIGGDGYATGGWRTGTGATFVGELTNLSGKLALQSDASRDIQLGDTNNPDIVYIDTSAQNVGIGDTTPLSKLEVAGSIKATNRSTGHSAEAGVTLSYDTSSNIALLETWTSKPLLTRTYNYQAFDISGTEKMRINSDGVGIGTTSPTGTFHVVGSNAIIDTADGSGLTINRPGNSAHLHLFPAYSSVPTIMGQGAGGLHLGYDSSTAGIRINTGNKVGVNQTTPKASFQVEEYGVDTTSTSSTATTQIAIHSFAAADFRSARFTVQVTNSTDSTYHTTELLLVHNGTTANITEFGEIHTGSAVEATFDADISSGYVRLLATPASTDTMAFKVVCHSITT